MAKKQPYTNKIETGESMEEGYVYDKDSELVEALDLLFTTEEIQGSGELWREPVRLDEEACRRFALEELAKSKLTRVVGSGWLYHRVYFTRHLAVDFLRAKFKNKYYWDKG